MDVALLPTELPDERRVGVGGLRLPYKDELPILPRLLLPPRSLEGVVGVVGMVIGLVMVVVVERVVP